MELIETLKFFGLSEYEAKALIVLLSKGILTAKEISNLSGIPRTSVYDVMNSLISKGLVESFGKPLKFKAINTDDIISILSKKVIEGLEILRKELPKVERERIEEVIIYRGDLAVKRLKDLIMESREMIIALISYISDELADLLNQAKCKLVVISSNPHVVKNAERYEFKRVKNIIERFKDFYHGLLVFDDEKVAFIFMNKLKICVVSESEGVVQFSKMIILSIIEYLKG